MRGRHHARLRLAAAVGVALGAAVACGVEVDIDLGPQADGGGPDGTSALDGGGTDAPNSFDADAGSTKTKIGDASVVVTKQVDLVAGESGSKLAVTLDKDPSDPSILDEVTVDITDSRVTQTALPTSPTTREYVLAALPDANPHRPRANVAARVGSATVTIPFNLLLSRFVRVKGDTPIDIPVNTPTTTYEISIWGAGGGSSLSAMGGAGGFARGQATLFGVYVVRVGAPGQEGGVFGGGTGSAGAGNGGGYSALYKTSVADASNVILLAAGGGGAGMNLRGGAGGQNGDGAQCGGGTPLSTAVPGIAGTGGGNATAGVPYGGGNGSSDAPTGGGGGAGWFGGGGGTAGCGGGGGISNKGPGQAITASFAIGSFTTPANAEHPYRGNAGEPQTAGAVLIMPLPPP